MREEILRPKEVKEKEKDENEKSVEGSLVEEIEAGEWTRLNRFETYNRRSRQGKIIAVYQAVSNRLNQLVQLYYEMVRNSPEKAVRLLKEIKRLRFLQGFLLDCLTWEERGELEDHEIPLELEGLF
ncbi:hypothetical protein C4577_02800 [Candidatus Parcubacteria bacterium]|nr:MAG: hypothetical protein C4577_02800 [Candidatus Parcubacteria bacterium]